MENHVHGKTAAVELIANAVKTASAAPSTNDALASGR